MKTTAVIALAVMTLAVAGCTTSDPTPPGSLGASSEEGEGGEAEGAPNEEEQAEGHGGEGAAGEASEGEDAASQTETEPEGGGEAASSGELPDPAQMSDEVCIAYFEGAAPLAGRAQDTLLLVERGSESTLTALEYQEVDVLAQRLEELAATGEDEQAALIESINAPFTQVQGAASGDGGEQGDSGEVSYDSIETEESEQAQAEFSETCSSAS